jgi:hypothetical protein
VRALLHIAERDLDHLLRVQVDDVAVAGDLEGEEALGLPGEHLVAHSLEGFADHHEAAGGRDAEPMQTKGYRLLWAKLLARVFREQVLVCPSCRGPRTIIATITDLDVAVTILDHLGLPTEQPVLQTARAPPQLELDDCFESEQRPD